MPEIAIAQTSIHHSLGALAALGSALCWAISAILFRALGQEMNAAAMNLGKGVVAIICLGALASMEASTFTINNTSALIISGLLGMAVGDTLYFLTLKHLGVRLTLLMGSLVPVVTGTAAIILLGERPSVLAVTGLATTVTGVTFVLWHRARESHVVQLGPGVAIALLFVLAHALAIILTKYGASDLPTSTATWLRHAASVGGLTLWALACGTLLEWVRPLRSQRLAAQLTLAALVGAVAGSWLSVAALKLTDASVATALNSTSPLFVLPLAVWWLKERITWHSVIGAGVAVSGIAIYFFSL